MRPLPFLLGVLLLGILPSSAQTDATPGPATEAAPAPRSMEEVVAAANDVLAQADAEYLDGLKAVYEQVRQTGDLEGLIAIDAERKRFEAMGQLDEAQLAPSPAALRQYQQESMPRLEQAVAARHRAVLAGAKRLEASLQSRIRDQLALGKLGEAGKLEEQRAAVRSHPAFLASAAYVPPAPPKPAAPASGPDAEDEADRIDESIFSNLKTSPAGYLWRFDEKSGRVSLDAHAKFPLLLRGNASLGEGHSGGALTGRAPGDSASMRYDTVPRNFPGQEYSGPRDFTLCARVFIEKIDFPLGVIHRRAASGRAFKLEVGADLVPEFTVYVGAEKSELRSPRAVEAGKWTHLAVTYEFKSRGHCTVRMFLNGVLAGTRNDFNGPPNGVSDAVHVGQAMSDKVTPRSAMKWRIDDLGVFPRALTGVEINALAK